MPAQLEDGPSPEIIEHPDFTAYIGDCRQQLIVSYPEQPPRHVDLRKGELTVKAAGLSGCGTKLWISYGGAINRYLCTSCWGSLPGPAANCNYCQ